MLFVCAACGRPRVPFEQPVTRSGRDREPLAKAEADLKSSSIAFGLAIVGFVIGAAAMGAGALAFLLESGVVAVVLFLAAFMFAGAGAFGVLTSRGAKKRADEQIGRASCRERV